ncbi:MAG: hypothetical protein QNJ13_11640 [Paracoccaceae bacterium]|nr:hypothetical protein [Paracoccaceae bacterium]
MTPSRDPAPAPNDAVPPAGWRELVEIALEGLPSADIRLEALIDRIEARR